MNLNNRYLIVTFNFHHIHLSSSLHMCLIIDTHRSLWELYGCHLCFSTPLVYATGVVFLSFDPFYNGIPGQRKFNVDPIPAIGDSQISPPQADFLYVKSPRCVWLSPIQINIDSLRCITSVTMLGRNNHTCIGNSMNCSDICLNTTSDISKLLYVISRAVRRVKFETILKLLCVVFMPNITYKSCY